MDRIERPYRYTVLIRQQYRGMMDSIIYYFPFGERISDYELRTDEPVYQYQLEGYVPVAEGVHHLIQVADLYEDTRYPARLRLWQYLMKKAGLYQDPETLVSEQKRLYKETGICHPILPNNKKQTVMERPQFIIELSKLRRFPCKEYYKYFKDGKADALEIFQKQGQQYAWLYENSDYDLIGFEIQNEIFDWKRHSRYLAQFCPQHLDPEKFNWEQFTWAVERYPEKFNWEQFTWAVERYCPHLLHLKPDNRNPDPGLSLSITTL